MRYNKILVDNLFMHVMGRNSVEIMHVMRRKTSQISLETAVWSPSPLGVQVLQHLETHTTDRQFQEPRWRTQMDNFTQKLRYKLTSLTSWVVLKTSYTLMLPLKIELLKIGVKIAAIFID